MNIEFYYTDTGVAILKSQSDNRLFVMNDKVYTDNNYSCESQEARVDFDTFTEETDNISWRIVAKQQ